MSWIRHSLAPDQPTLSHPHAKRNAFSDIHSSLGVGLWQAPSKREITTQGDESVHSQFGRAGAPGIAVGVAPGVATRVGCRPSVAAVAALSVMDTNGTAL